jgi:hypothetical protein
MSEDSESSSFLHEEDKERLSGEELLGPAAIRWRHWPSVSCFLPYMLAVLGIFATFVVLQVFSKDSREKSLLPSQSMFSESKSSVSLLENAKTSTVSTSISTYG